MASKLLHGSTGGPDKTYPLMSRAEIESMIAQGRKLIIVNQHVLKVDAWLPYHPGGSKSIMHMVGRDATDEVNWFVARPYDNPSPTPIWRRLHSDEARRNMERYRIGRVEGIWKNFIPPIQGGIFQDDNDAMASVSARAVASTASTSSLASTPACHSSESESSSRSTSPPPVFDDEDIGASASADNCTTTPKAVRRRPVKGLPLPCAAAPFTASQNESCDGLIRDEKRNPQSTTTAFLDAKTSEEIRLDLDKYPSLDAQTQQNVIRRYRGLHKKIQAAGLFDCNYTAYAWEVSRYILLFVSMVLFLRMRWYAVSAACLGAFWHQLAFTVHDAGHMGITHSFHGDTVIGIIVADFLGGLSICWWKDNHNVHHIITNSPEHDPDIEHMPFFAISHRLLLSLRSTYYDKIMEYDAAARFFLSIQAYSYYLILCFGRFNLYRLSWHYIILGLGPRKGPAWWHRWLEAAGQVFFWTWFGYGIVYKSIDSNWDRFVFIMVSHVVTMPLHLQITLSHFAMSTADLGPHESFPQRMLRTTMDVDCPQWLDFFHGGLQFQAIHHLFPRMPRHNLRAAQKMVQDFCNEVGIPYALYGFVEGNKEVIGRLADVSKQAAILAQCQKAIVGGTA